MDLIYIFLLAIGLSADSFSISVTAGYRSSMPNIKEGLKIAGVFGLFHILMIISGSSIGFELEKLVSGVDHWIAFGFLLFIGLKMIFAGVKGNSKAVDMVKKRNLLLLAIATSIDAFIIGISFAFININPLFVSLVVGFVVLTISALGYGMGGRLGKMFSKKFEIAGGLVLILIGFKILLEHLV